MNRYALTQPQRHRGTEAIFSAWTNPHNSAKSHFFSCFALISDHWIITFPRVSTNRAMMEGISIHLWYETDPHPSMQSLLLCHRISSLFKRSSSHCLYLYQVATGVVEDGYGHILHYFWRLYCELHPELLQSFIVYVNIRNPEVCRGNALLENCFLVCFCCGIIIPFKYELGAVLILRRDNGEPPVIPAIMSLFFKKPRICV